MHLKIPLWSWTLKLSNSNLLNCTVRQFGPSPYWTLADPRIFEGNIWHGILESYFWTYYNKHYYFKVRSRSLRSHAYVIYIPLKESLEQVSKVTAEAAHHCFAAFFSLISTSTSSFPDYTRAWREPLLGFKKHRTSNQREKEKGRKNQHKEKKP
jgi:hypothetical protein